MDILEMKGVCSILRYILHVHVDFMDSLTQIAVVLEKLSSICHLEVRFNCRITV